MPTGNLALHVLHLHLSLIYVLFVLYYSRAVFG